MSEAVDLRTAYKKLEENGRPVFIAALPEELSLGGMGLSLSGEIKKEYTAFRRWYDAHRAEGGVICVDVRKFNAGQLAQLNDLFDREIEGYGLEKERFKIVLIDGNERSHYGIDFRRRVRNKVSVQSEKEELLEKEPQATSSEESKREVRINLFESANWERLLLGNWVLKKKEGENDFSFEWKEGELLKLFKANQGVPLYIVFENPPLNSSGFTSFVARMQGLGEISYADRSLKLSSNWDFGQAENKEWKDWLGQENVRVAYLKEETPLLLSNNTLLSFIEAERYAFDEETGKLEAKAGYLKEWRTENRKVMDVIFSPGLTEASFSQFFTEAHKQGIQVRVLVRSKEAMPDFLNVLSPSRFEEKDERESRSEKIEWYLHADVYYAVRKRLREEPRATYFDMASLLPSELSWYPKERLAEIRDRFLKEGRFVLESQLSDLVRKLQKGETVILGASGRLSPELYDGLMELSLGRVGGKAYSGKLIVIANQNENECLKYMAGHSLELKQVTQKEKEELLEEIYGERIVGIGEGEAGDFASLERSYLSDPLRSPSGEIEGDTAEERSERLDERRLRAVETGLSKSPWVMLEGVTGIGKSYFLEHVLAKKLKNKETTYSLALWLKNKNGGILIVDEASLVGNVSGEGEGFLERFEGLYNRPPGFYWQGEYWPLTEKHKVVFAFNPASYGGGRSTEGFLNAHTVRVSFERLPYYYIQARLVIPQFRLLLKEELARGEIKEKTLNNLSNILGKVYEHLLQVSSQRQSESGKEEVLMTPREVKLMVNLLVAEIKRENIRDEGVLQNLATEMAYEIGKQALSDIPGMSEEFEAFKPTQSVLSRQMFKREEQREGLGEHQKETYYFIRNLLEMRNSVLKEGNTDLGLGGVFLEGDSGVGKTYFVNFLVKEYVESHSEQKNNIYYISGTTPLHEKERLLREAFNAGGIVISNEFNLGLWPMKLLNNYLMGVDENGVFAKKPGFILIGTQNPASFEGRAGDEDEALRRRVIKLKLNWLEYKASEKKEEEKQPPLLQALAGGVKAEARLVMPIVEREKPDTKKESLEQGEQGATSSFNFSKKS
ncbi:MAG: hypothetical protein A3B69_01550 [Gammaproteobacteria bacterium RIFCSPHIGHO2_02_FULL_38_33]|nr:MAG: hypothetical protein A3B69_01550 [Gammaproteobacteria bacterium RIFCSPHIGHO2_02_FULL_38_33]